MKEIMWCLELCVKKTVYVSHQLYLNKKHCIVFIAYISTKWKSGYWNWDFHDYFQIVIFTVIPLIFFVQNKLKITVLKKKKKKWAAQFEQPDSKLRKVIYYICVIYIQNMIKCHARILNRIFKFRGRMAF